MDRKEATVRPVEAIHDGRSAGVDRLGRRLLTSALVLFPLSGCSLAFVDGPSSTPPPSRNACTTSYAAPTLDLLGVSATFLLGFGFGGFERSLEAVAPDDDDTFGNLEKASLAASGALLVSSVYGLVQVGRCRGSREAGGGPPLLPNRFGDRFLGTVPDRRVPAGGASTLPSDLVSPGCTASLFIGDVAPRDPPFPGGRRMPRQCGVATPACSVGQALAGDLPRRTGPRHLQGREPATR